ncbi:MAG: hypothetical protein RLZZ227_133 [Pseudomonadota bacterium]|jgi:multidrug efflux pump subunit AcrA (membrane-fusion protein)
MNNTNSKARSREFTLAHNYSPRYLGPLTAMRRTRLPSILRVVAWMIAIGIVLVSVALWQIPWVQTTTGAGRVTTLDPRDRVQNISALVAGRIAEWYVQDGMFVRAGDPIVRIEDVDQSYVERLQAQLDAARRKYSAARAAVDTAGLDVARRDDLLADGLTSQLDSEQARIRLQQLRVSAEQALSELNQAEVNLSRQGSQLVTAPRNGTILQVAAGDTATIVTAGQTLATFVPADAERVVELYIDGRDVGLVREGRDVRLEFEGWPAFQFSGIPEVAVGTFAGVVVFIEPNARTDGRFRVLVAEKRGAMRCVDSRPSRPGFNSATDCGWPPGSFVHLGANARGWILLETVPLGYELWRRLNNFPPVKEPLSVSAGRL